MLNQYSRTELLFGREAMEKLRHARVAIFGIGGVGGYTVEALVRSGIGAVDLIDDDKVCLTNINRQIYATRKTIGQYKVDVAAERIAEITNIIPVAAFADLAQYDTIQTGQNRQAMFVASRNLLQQLSQAVVLFIVPIVITGSVADGVAYYGGVRRTALIAAGFILGALLCYVFYRDKRITTAINQYNERQHRGNEERT